MKKINQLAITAVLLGSLISCSKNQIDKTTDFIPGIVDYDFFIEGEIDDKLLRYPQVDVDGSDSNVYFTEYKSTWLSSSYTDAQEGVGSWSIRFYDIDIHNIKLPYTLEISEGSVFWFDSRVDLLIKNNPNCGGIDNGCIFALPSGENKITITSIENNIIEGEFGGKATIIGTGHNRHNDSSVYHRVFNGKFKIKYKNDSTK